MDDISRESSPEDSGAAPVSERQKGPEELVRFERGHVDGGDPSFDLEGRFAAHYPTSGRAFSIDVEDGEDPGEDAAVTPPSGEAEERPEPTPGVAPTPQEGEEAVEREDGPATNSATPGSGIDEESARAAVAAEESTASIEQDLDEIVDTDLGEDGLPVVPELTDVDELSRVLFVLMLSSRDGMTIFRLAQACNSSQKLIEEALGKLQQTLRDQALPVELARVGDSVRWMSAASTFPYLQRLRGVKKLEKLSPAALETLAVIAYRQPVMRSEIEAIRGVKAGPMLRTLLQHKLVKVAGRADVPGRPLQYGTTPSFLERFGLASLQDLPSVKEWKNLG